MHSALRRSHPGALQRENKWLKGASLAALLCWWTICLYDHNDVILHLRLPMATAFGMTAYLSIRQFRKSTDFPTPYLSGCHAHSRNFALMASRNKKSPATKDASSPLRELYPAPPLLVNGSLPVADGSHILAYQIYGKNQSAGNGLVALFLHGGPGAACFPNHARFFDWENRYDRIVLLDQRGCGGSFLQNISSTPEIPLADGQQILDLVEDCEHLRKHLDIPQWNVVLGGSWGTTLALAYAQTYRQSVGALVLRGVCLFRRSEVDHLFAEGPGTAAQAYPQAWSSFRAALGMSLKKSASSSTMNRDVLHGYYDQFWSKDTNETQRTNLARAWMQWEFFNSVSYKLPKHLLEPSENSDKNATFQAMRAALQQWKPSEPAIIVDYHPQNGWSYQTPNDPTPLADSTIRDAKLPMGAIDIETILRKDQTQEYDDEKTFTEHQQARPIANPLLAPKDMISGGRQVFPMQSMLTCYYSTNPEYCMNGISILDPARMAVLHDLPCVLVQGGADPICPPTSALDLLKAWPEGQSGRKIGLRLPLQAGHSMYDPFLTHEVLRATDALGDYFLSLARKKAESRDPAMLET